MLPDLQRAERSADGHLSFSWELPEIRTDDGERAGQLLEQWIPAFAGMTCWFDRDALSRE